MIKNETDIAFRVSGDKVETGCSLIINTANHAPQKVNQISRNSQQFINVCNKARS